MRTRVQVFRVVWSVARQSELSSATATLHSTTFRVGKTTTKGREEETNLVTIPKRLVVQFNERDGSLSLSGKRSTISRELTCRDFLLKCHNYLRNFSADTTADEFYFAVPVVFADNEFMLSVSFRDHTKPYCTAYSLEPSKLLKLEDKGASGELKHRRELTDFLSNQLSVSKRIDDLSNRAIWKYAWGIVSVGTVSQNSFRLTISVGWTRQSSNQVSQL